MHELAIAQSVLKAVQTESPTPSRLFSREGRRPYRRSLAFGFEALTKGTEWERLALEVEPCSGGELELAYLELEES